MTFNRNHVCRPFLLLAAASLAWLSAPSARASNPPCSTKNVIGPANAIEIANIQPAQGTTIYTSPGTEHTFSLSATDIDEYGDPLLCNEDRLDYRWSDSAGGSQTGDRITYDFVPPDAGYYTVTCTVKDPAGAGKDAINPSVTWNVVAVKVKIYWDSVDVTGQTQDTIVGKKINLTAEVMPTGLNVTSYQWTIPGNRIKGYMPSPLIGTVTYISATDLIDQSVHYYWVDGGTNRNTYCKVEVEGKEYSGATFFNVVRPNTSVSSATQSVIVGQYDGSEKFGLFKSPPNPLEGIMLTRGQIDPTQLQGGTTCYIQVVNSFLRDWKDTVGTEWRMSGNGKLDSNVPYPYADATVLWDSPGNYTTGHSYEGANDTFSTYLMYVPAGYGSAGSDGILVPLRKTNWHWSGQAYKIGMSWSVVFPSWSPDPQSVECTDHPTWIGRVQDEPAFTAIAITTTSLPNGMRTVNYYQEVNTSGGKPPVSIYVQSGYLPPGLNLSNGVISGAPTQGGDWSFVIRAVDSSCPYFSDDQQYYLHIDWEP